MCPTSGHESDRERALSTSSKFPSKGTLLGLILASVAEFADTFWYPGELLIPLASRCSAIMN